MDCKTLHRKMIFYIDGELPNPEMEKIKFHLDECSDCAAFYEEVRKTLDVLTAEKQREVNPFFYTRLKARLENQSAVQPAFQQNRVWAKMLQPAFFTVLLLAGIYSGIKIGQPASGSSGSSVYAAHEMIPYLNEMESETIEAFLME